MIAADAARQSRTASTTFTTKDRAAVPKRMFVKTDPPTARHVVVDAQRDAGLLPGAARHGADRPHRCRRAAHRWTMLGDPITVKGMEGKLQNGNGWTDCNLSWDEYVRGSALPVGA